MVSRDALTICKYPYSTGRERKKLLRSCSNPRSAAQSLGRVCGMLCGQKWKKILTIGRYMTHLVRFTIWRVRLEGRGGYELMSHLKNRAKINVSFFDV